MEFPRIGKRVVLEAMWLQRPQIWTCGQAEFNADFNANFNADGKLQVVPTPKVQRQWEAASTPMGRLQILTPKGACHITT